ncbi:cysteine synthase A [Viscerimonas tarda]
MKYNNILDSIGNTPHLRLSRLYPEHEVWIKLEKQNPGGSIKDRIALAMIEDADRKGILKPNGAIIEPTSGNAGIGLSLVAALKGYKMIITMPESMSVERRKYMEALGAIFILTPRELGMKGAIDEAVRLSEEIEGAWIPQQFENPANPEIHRLTTAKEIIADFPDGFDYFISGVGTGGHITGIGEVLKQQFPNIKVIAVEPDSSPVISGGSPGTHAIQGIGAGFIPKVFNVGVVDEIVTVSKEEAFEFARKVVRTEGMLGGISTGATLAAIDKRLKKEKSKKKVITVNYDTGERYLSIEGLY